MNTVKDIFPVTTIFAIVLLIAGSISLIAHGDEFSPDDIYHTRPLPTGGSRYIKMLTTPGKINLILEKDKPQIAKDYDLEVNFLGINDKGQARLDINYSGRAQHHGFKTGTGQGHYTPPGWDAANLLQYAKTIYRAYYTCDGTLIKKTTENMYPGNKDFTGTNRFYEQCKTFQRDGYVEEHLDYGVVPFYIGETKQSYEASITVKSASAQEAEVNIFYIGQPKASMAQKVVSPGTEVKGPCADFSDKLEQCEPYQCKKEIDNVQIIEQITGTQKDRCLVTEMINDSYDSSTMKTLCRYPVNEIQEIAQFYKGRGMVNYGVVNDINTENVRGGRNRIQMDREVSSGEYLRDAYCVDLDSGKYSNQNSSAADRIHHIEDYVKWHVLNQADAEEKKKYILNEYR